MKYLLLCVFCLLLVSCAPRSSKPVNTEQTPQAVLSPDQQLALFMGESQPGLSASFTGTSFGETVTATTRDAYVSALGEFCREGVASTSGGNTRISACQDKQNNEWRLAPIIFRRGAL